MKRLSFAVLFCLLLSSLRVNAASPVVISEFMSSNTRTLRDETGQYPDWIEIQNVSTTNVNLLNWSLTDNDNNLTKWRFPETNLNAGAFMIIYAASPEQRVPGAPLRTGFALSAGGEYLALVDPNGVIAIEYSADFPQTPDVSFGLARLTTNNIVVTTNSAVRVRVPANGNDGTNWTLAGFDDGAWTAGVNGVGYGNTNATVADYSAVISPTAPVGYWRLNESSGTTAASLGSLAGADGTYTSATVGTAGPRPPQFNGFEANNNCPAFNGTSSYVGVNNSLLSGRGAFTVGGWVRKAAAQAARTGLFGQNDCVEFGFISDAQLQCWTPGGGSVDAPVSLALNTWYHIVAVGNGSNIRIFTNGVLAASGGAVTSSYGTSASPFNIGGNGVFDATGNFFNGQIDEVVAYHRALSVAEIQALYSGGLTPASVAVTPYVKTDISSAMSNVNASAYIRLPFNVENPTNVAQLTLRVRYDDGLVAFINGIPVVGANAPESLAFNSSATSGHSPGSVEEFRFNGTVLQPGANMLAIQGLNLAAADEDFLVVAELTATAVLAESPIPLYFTTPSPGAENVGGVANPGPAILDAAHAPNVPSDADDIFVTARILPTFAPVVSVVMRYRTMFGPELEVEMFDNGAHGDGAAADGIYGASIPASAATTSQMVRWFIRSTDNVGRTSRWPLYANPADSAEYLGTVINPDYVTSKLPIIHLFAPANILQAPSATATTAIGADSQAGSRVSLFHDGEFYDNVHMQLRGNTTAGYNKKSHRIEFNREHLLKHSGPGPRIRETSFVADYPDPTYMRQGLSFWLCELLGSPASFYIPHRLQLNGQFYQLANHNDVHGGDLLSRLGYDPNGALYNAAGTVVPSQFSTGGFEKKTRRYENNADYTALANALAETLPLAVRGTNFFENFDVPNAINYLVAARWVHENDDVWANMSLYHDNDGDNLWRIVSFDMNLSWGAIFYEGGNPLVIEGVQATNDIHKAHPFYGGSTALALSGPGAPNNFNRVYDVVFQSPRLREMYLRRMRTMMDTYVKSPGTHPLALFMEKKVLEWRDLIAEEAVLDRTVWGWPAKGGQNNFDPPAGNPAFGTTARTNAAITALTNGVNGLLSDFIGRRRNHFYGRHSITNTALPIGITKADNAGIPLAQPTNAEISITAVEFNPASGNQAQEFIAVTNPNPYALDISGWKLGGGVDFTFHLGTVMPSNGVLYVSPDVKAFRARTVGPRGGQGLFVVGPYQGQLSARGEQLYFLDDKGRGMSTNTYAGSPSLAQNFLRITEIMYNPAPLAGNAHGPQEFEFIELKNISGGATLGLTGVRFVNGIEFNFTGSAVTSLSPGQRVLVVKNPAAFAARYGGGLPVAGTYVGNLENDGERLQLVDAQGEEVLDFDYEDDWYPVTDGVGFSLAVVDENAEPDLWDSKTNWRPSGVVNGAPGQNDPAPPAVAPIVINEVLTHTDLPAVDAIELYNPTASPVNVGGWFLSDDTTNAYKFRIPDNTIIAADGYVTFTEAQFNSSPGSSTSFAFSSKGDEAYLYSGNGTELTGYLQGYSFGAAANGVSFGRYIDSQTNVHFVAQTSVTLNAVNSGPKVGPVVISEVMYHPADVAGGNENSDEEYIELRNIADAPVALFDPSFPVNTWRLRGGVDFNFPPGVVLAANGSLLLVGFNPTGPGSAGVLDAFREKYGVPVSQPIFGPYSGQLNNAGDSVRIERPDEPEAGEVSYVVVDRLDYEDQAPWPDGADGTGASLQRINLPQHGNDPINWTAATGTAGSGFVGGAAPVITTQPLGRIGLASQTATFNVVAGGSGPLRYQWRFNGATINGATNSLLILSNLQLEQAGIYSVAVYNGAGSVQSAEATLTVLLPAYFTLQPQSVSIRGSTNNDDYGSTTNRSAAFTVAAIGNGPLSYQWRFNGTNVAGAGFVGGNSPTLTVNNVHYDLHDGVYEVLLTDDVGSVVSVPVRLSVLLTPMIIQAPLAQSVPSNGTMSVSVVIKGNPPPFRYIWNQVSVPRGIFITDERTNYFTYGPITNLVSQNWRIIITNAAFPAPGANIQFPVIALADVDQDGLPDSYESGVPGLNPNNAADAAGDLDLDGMRNKDEYLAGTDPANPASYLRVDFGATPGMATIQVAAVANRTYTVQYTGSLDSSVWSKLGNIVARTTDRVESLPDPGWTSNRFYRVVLPALP